MAKIGKVYLVGAGPGDPGLLTLKGKTTLERAACVVYDFLANPELLTYAPPGAETIFVGKKEGEQGISQEEINQLLLSKAREGKDVVRLKGGDPFVFGRVIKTTGDQHPELSLTRSGTKGLFTKEIEESLLGREADLAVHSFKDLPNDQPKGLTVAAFLEREDARDVLISRDHRPFSELPPNARIGTSSLRRQSQLRDLRPDLEFTNIRGNLDTRPRNLERGDCDALMVAAAGILRPAFGGRPAQPSW